MTAFELVAKLTADTSSFDSAMKKAGRTGNNLKGSLESTFAKIKTAAAGALSVAAIKKGINATISLANAVSQAGDRVDKQSQALGLSRKAFQEWDYILGQNGASIDSMGVSMKTLNALILEAADGSKEAKSSFAKLGIGIHELEKLNPEEQFEAVVRAFQRMPAGAEKSALAVKIFGRNGMELLPLLNQSETSIDELRKRAEELGLVMSDDAVDAAVVYGDSLDDLQRTLTAFKNAIGAKILPVLTSGVQKLTDYVGKLRKAYDKDGFAGVFDTLNASFTTFVENLKASDSPVLQKIGAGLEAIKTAFNWILENKESVAAAVGAIVAAFAAAKIASFVASINPLTVIFAAIAAGIALVAANWDEIKDWIGKAWNTTVSFVSEGWETVKGAFDTVASWVGEKANKIKLAFTATVTEWFTRIKEWLDGTGLTEIALNFGAKVVEWIETIKSWFDGTGLSDVTVNFGAKIAEWIERIWDWAQNGIDVAVKFLSSGLSGAGGEDHDVYGEWHGNPIMVDPQANVSTNAKGLNYVPYNNFPALLHRGEQVLTASQARRRGNGGTDVAALLNGLTGAVREGISGAQLNSYMDSTKVTSKTNDVTGRKLISRRFAPA